jgi:hypothetical protein
MTFLILMMANHLRRHRRRSSQLKIPWIKMSTKISIGNLITSPISMMVNRLRHRRRRSSFHASSRRLYEDS